MDLLNKLIRDVNCKGFSRDIESLFRYYVVNIKISFF